MASREVKIQGRESSESTVVVSVRATRQEGEVRTQDSGLQGGSTSVSKALRERELAIIKSICIRPSTTATTQHKLQTSNFKRQAFMHEEDKDEKMYTPKLRTRPLKKNRLATLWGMLNSTEAKARPAAPGPTHRQDDGRWQGKRREAVDVP